MSNAEYLKRYAAPKSWHIDRKSNQYIAKPNPGPHGMNFGMPLGVVLRLLNKTVTSRETRKALVQQDIKVDSRRVRDQRFPVGLLDVISIGVSGENFVVVLDHKGRLSFRKVPVSFAGKKICRIDGKSVMRGGKIQVNLSDGRNLLIEKNQFAVGDSLLIEVPSQKIVGHLPLKDGSFILLVSGKHAGSVGVVQSVAGDIVTYSDGKETMRTRPVNSYVITKEYYSLMQNEQ